ncbi:unnamed protein product, partial [Polarella glacialis]
MPSRAASRRVLTPVALIAACCVFWAPPWCLAVRASGWPGRRCSRYSPALLARPRERSDGLVDNAKGPVGPNSVRQRTDEEVGDDGPLRVTRTTKSALLGLSVAHRVVKHGTAIAQGQGPDAASKLVKACLVAETTLGPRFFAAGAGREVA